MHPTCGRRTRLAYLAGAADLRLADLSGSDCNRTNFASAILASVNIDGVRFDDAISLTQQQFYSARTERPAAVRLQGIQESAPGS